MYTMTYPTHEYIVAYPSLGHYSLSNTIIIYIPERKRRQGREEKDRMQVMYIVVYLSNGYNA